MLRGKSKERSSSARKVTPPSPTYMNNDQFAAYLANLRDSRVNRPGGARPLPPSSKSKPQQELNRKSTERLATGRPSLGSTSILSEASSSHQRTQSDTARPRGSRPSFAPSIASRYSTAYSTTSSTGRDYYPENPTTTTPLKPGEVVPSATYIERGQRWMEKEEAVSLREAMDAMDSMNVKDEDKDAQEEAQPDDDESRIYNAALDEAAELVWRHEHGIKTPEPGAPYRYKPHMRKNSYAHARTASAGRYGSEIGATGLARDSVRSFSGSSSGSDRAPSPGTPRESLEQQRTYSMESTKSNPKSKSYGSLGGAPRSSSGGRRLSSLKRNISGEIERPFSGDQIWEEPEAASPERNPRQPQLPQTTQPLGLKSRGIPNRVQFAPTETSDSTAPLPAVPTKPLSRFEIHKNPPSQSRNPAYTTNSPSDSPRTSQEGIATKNGMEIRSDDIRQATSMRLKDRSSKLPTPSAVSDSPGRPIKSPPSPTLPAAAATATTINPESDLSERSSQKSARVHKPRSRLLLPHLFLLSQLRRILRPRGRRPQQHGHPGPRRPSQVFR